MLDSSKIANIIALISSSNKFVAFSAPWSMLDVNHKVQFRYQDHDHYIDWVEPVTAIENEGCDDTKLLTFEHTSGEYAIKIEIINSKQCQQCQCNITSAKGAIGKVTLIKVQENPVKKDWEHVEMLSFNVTSYNLYKPKPQPIPQQQQKLKHNN